MKLYLSGLIPFLISCASTHPGSMGQSLTPHSKFELPMIVSASTIDRAAEESFQLVEITIENKSGKWLRIHKARVVMDQETSQSMSVVLGQDLKDWADAMKLRLQKDQHNKQMLQAGLMTAGAVAAASGSQSNNSNLASAGVIVLAGSYVWAVSDVISSSLRNAESVDKVPQNHLHQPFSVPGKMFLRKWILFNKPPMSIIRSLVIDFETVEGEKGTYEIKI
jgi:hypothetical protein